MQNGCERKSIYNKEGGREGMINNEFNEGKLTKAIREALNKTINEIAEEEIKAATEQIRKRILANTSQVSVNIIKNLSWPDDNSKITIEFKPKDRY